MQVNIIEILQKDIHKECVNCKGWGTLYRCQNGGGGGVVRYIFFKCSPGDLVQSTSFASCRSPHFHLTVCTVKVPVFGTLNSAFSNFQT